MTEPVYVYKKGEGWVPCVWTTATAIIGKWEITLTDEPPKKGDYLAYAAPSSTPAQVLELIVKNNQGTFSGDYHHLMPWDGKARGDMYMAFTLRKVDGSEQDQ